MNHFSEKGYEVLLVTDYRGKKFINNIGNLELEKITIGWRPLPIDGKPVMGRLKQYSDIYVAVMHSGISLAAIAGKLISQEILDGSSNSLLKDFRPSRFL